MAKVSPKNAAPNSKVSTSAEASSLRSVSAAENIVPEEKKSTKTLNTISSQNKAEKTAPAGKASQTTEPAIRVSKKNTPQTVTAKETSNQEKKKMQKLYDNFTIPSEEEFKQFGFKKINIYLITFD